MFSIMLLIAAFQTGDGVTILCVIAGLIVFWAFVISGLKAGAAQSKNSGTQASARRKDPIDEHMDYYYGDIDWLRKGKL